MEKSFLIISSESPHRCALVFNHPNFRSTTKIVAQYTRNEVKEIENQKIQATTSDVLAKMQNVDIRNVDRNALVDINSVSIHRELPIKECVLDYMKQIKNPYCYLDHGMVVKISFAGKRTLEDCIKSVVFSEHSVL